MSIFLYIPVEIFLFILYLCYILCNYLKKFGHIWESSSYIYLQFQLFFFFKYLDFRGWKLNHFVFQVRVEIFVLNLSSVYTWRSQVSLLWPSRVWTLTPCETFAVWTCRRGDVLGYCSREHWKQLTSLLGGDENLYFPLGLLWPYWHGEVGGLSFSVDIHH